MTASNSAARWRGPLSTLLWLAGITLLLTWGVGALDQWAAPTQTGARLMQRGMLLGPLLIIAAVLTKPKRGLNYKQLTAVAVGLWPFAAFTNFFVWQFGMTGEQAMRCDAGEARQCEMLATRRERRGKFEEAAPYFLAGCEQGLLTSCHHYAAMLRDGRGLPADPAAALVLFERACDEGDRALSCQLAGSQHKRGTGVPQNLEVARARFEKACGLGLASACAEVELLDALAINGSAAP